MAMAKAPLPSTSAMTTVHDVADSTDWLATPLSDLMPIESSLRCQVCKDFFTTPMITSCSHTFCSLCIRRYLSQEGKCPACREADQEIRLRRNWVVEELVAGFVQGRESMLKLARAMAAGSIVDDSASAAATAACNSGQNDGDTESEAQRPKKRRKGGDASGSNVEVRHGTRSQSRRLATSAQSATQTQEEGEDEDKDDDEDGGSVYQDEPELEQMPEPEPDGMVTCPSCSRRIKGAAINSHLDRCLSGAITPPTPPRGAAPIPRQQPAQMNAGAFSTISYAHPKPSSNVRLPTINYALLNESRLRSKLRDLGIPSTGSKELMCKRHTEWVNLWNANCDSLKQLPKRDLLRQLDTWERTQGRQIEHKEAAGTGVMGRDFDRKGYMEARKTDFDALIAEARARAKVGAGAGAGSTSASAASQEPAGQVVDNEETVEEKEEEREHDHFNEHVNGNASSAIATTTPATPTTINPPDKDRNYPDKHEHGAIVIPDSSILTEQPPVLSS